MASINGKTSKLPVYMKYAKTAAQSWLDPNGKLKPSDLTKPSLDIDPENYPLITQFNNIVDNTVQVHSTVDIDVPIFEPAPKIVLFEDYQAFTLIKKKLYFRNKDSVARRIKLLKPDTPFFEISAPYSAAGEPLQQSKIASGMEVYFIVTFRPQEIREYSWDLVCSTERENFIVPLRAVGLRPFLDFPDTFDFGQCPIKSSTEKKIVVQNTGTAAAKFTMVSHLSEVICPEQDISIEPNASYQLTIHFTPISTSQVAGEIEVVFSNGIRCYIGVTGFGKNVEVSLSTPSLTLDSSYISLFSQKTLKIRNLSDAPIRYKWKSFSTEDEEEAERDRLLQEINRIEEEERSDLQSRVLAGFYDSTDEDNQRNDAIGYGFEQSEYPSNSHLPFSARVDEAILTRKYRNLRKALEIDKMLFVDDIFDISPVEGEVWAHSDMEITVCFRPDTAAQYDCLGFLDVSGRHERLPLQLSGQGIGPHAALSFEVLDIGDVFVNDKNYYELSIKNKGDIPAQWTFMSSLTRFGNKFHFSPTEGYLLPNQTEAIKISFESDILGEFSEHFRFALQGNEDMLICQIKGNVIGPTFHFDTTSIDFGTVSFDYLHSTVVRLVNTSKVPMVYNLHIPQDGTYMKREFNIEPSNGTLGPKDSVEILVEFIPTTIKIYEYSLAVDVLGVGDVLLSIPISAECIVSAVKVDLPSRELDFGDVFIRYPYEQELRLINLSNSVHTKFEIAPQPKHTVTVASYEASPSLAIIEPGDSISVKIRLIGKKLGSYKVPLTICIAGSQEPPIQAVLVFNTVGPKVSVSTTELKWGSIECLKDSVRQFTISNDGLISASMKLFLKMARSCYSLDIRELVLEAGQSYDLSITANLDDSIVNKDEVHVVVDEGDNLMVPLIARGMGTTMFCKSDLSVLDLGVQLTSVKFERHIVLENKGRRPQVLRWTNLTNKTENEARIAKAKKSGKDDKIPKSSLAEPLFTVTPEEIILRSRTATTFTFRGHSSFPRSMQEIFILESKVGKERQMKQIMQTEVRCEVVNPLLTVSESELSFLYVWDRDNEPQIQRKTLTFTNSTAIPLTFVLQAELPFNLSSFEQTLEAAQSCDIVVEFDPGYRDDRESHVKEHLMQIIYRGHPQKDSVKLVGEVVFPNLKFDANAINFGCVLNETSKLFRLKLQNSCKIDVTYKWEFMEPAVAKSKSRGAIFTTPPSHVFDILPVNSVIQPGMSEDVEFTMLSTSNSKHQCTVICVVDGGPEYKFHVQGESSNVAYALDKSVFDFGKVIFMEKSEQELGITNNGRVTFNYELVPTTDEDAKYLEFVPVSGKVAAGNTVKPIIRMRPGLPAYIKCSFTVKVAHFDPVVIECFCQGIFPAVFVGLPRYRKIGPSGETDHVNRELWENFQNAAVTAIVQPTADYLPPAIFPEPAMGTTINPPSFNLDMLPPVPPGEDALEDIDSASASATGLIGSHSLASATKGLSPAIIDIEMQRASLYNQLADKLRDIGPNAPIVATTAVPQTPANGILPLQEVINRYISLKEIIAGRYLCDFGNVIVGQTKKKVFRITNSSLAGQLSWVFDKKYLPTGYTIEPEKVQKLDVGGSVDFTVKFFARSSQKNGHKQCTLPVEIPGVPTLNIILAANVCIPEIELSTHHIDFGRVVIGRSSKIYLSFKNISPVTANWSFKKTPNKHNDDTKFNIEPASGSLRPNKKAVVAIEFLPTEIHKCSLEIIVRVDQNRKNQSIKVVGEGIGTPLTFEPSLVEIKPVIPFSEGGEQIITVSNPSDFPVEFYSVDFDSAFKEEEVILSAINEYDGMGVIRSAVRSAGDLLPKNINDAYQRAQDALKEAAEQSLASTAKPAPAAVNDAELNPEVTGQEANVAVDAVATEQTQNNPEVALLKPSIRSKPGYRDANKHQDIIVIAPPKGGATTLAQSLSKRLLIPIITFDNMINDVAQVDHPCGVLARYFLGKSRPEELAEYQAREQEFLASAEKSKAEAAENYKKNNKKAKDVPEEVYATPEVAAYNAFLTERNKNAENISKILSFRMEWQDFSDGFVYDGLRTSIVPADTLIAALQISIPQAIYALVSIENGAEGYDQWIDYLFHSKSSLIEKLEKSIETNKKAIFKTVKASKGKPLDVALKEMEERYAVIPEALPRGDESWIDVATGEVCELDANDQKTLEEKDRLAYLNQILYSQSVILSKAKLDVQEIVRYRKPKEVEIVDAAEANEVSAQSTSEADLPPIESVTNTVVDFTYESYSAEILAHVSSIRKGAAIPKPKKRGTKKAKNNDQNNDDMSVASEASAGTMELQTLTEGVEPTEAPAPEVVIDEGGLYELSISPEETAVSVLHIAQAHLPSPKVTAAEKENVLPDVEMFQVYRKPINRPHRKAIKHFHIVDLSDELIKPKVVEAPPVVEPVVDPKAKKGGKPAAKAPEVVVEQPVAPVVAEPPKPPPTRWIVPPQSSVQVKVRFKCEKEGTFESAFEFEVVGSGQKFTVPCKCLCEYPKINLDTKHFFSRRLKAINPANPYPLKRYAIADNVYSFGALALFKKPAWKKVISDGSSEEDKSQYTQIESTHSDTFRITNNGQYKCTVNLALEYEEGDAKDVFVMDPPSLEVEEGETKEVRAWALVKEVREYKSTLVVTVDKNPAITKFPIKCIAGDPTVDLIGPWTETITKAEEALASNTDKKKAKELEANLAALKEAFAIDFDRVLIGKVEGRTFTVKNTSSVPVAWEIMPEDFTDSSNISFVPPSGVLAYNASVDVTVNFTSPDPLMLTGKFSLKFADDEGGLQTSRAIVRKFKAIAEAYSINAVSLNSEGKELKGTSEMDFGIVRVGDYAVQTLKMGNKGKYKIGYSFHHTTPAITDLVTIEPMEGTIDTGNALAEIKVTFCAKNGEIALKSNPEIMVHISEPTTGEVVEKFPLLITAQAKYNRFRLQPSKGISFGAIRFDADPRVKRAELRNESKFEITYVICGAIAEHDELDDLDAGAFAAYAFASPAAIRAKELGDNYLQRIGGGGSAAGGAKGAKKEAKPPPAKGKGAAVEAPPPSSLNPLVQDPDALAQVPLPTDPLVVGAFTIHPRMSTIQPGQSINIDMKFDPSGCQTVKEKLRICICGADPNDPLTNIIRTFELTGESCLPALVSDDFYSIFEEQEVVGSLAESTGEKSISGGKLEKLPVGKVVYAESEKMLAFGPVACNQSGRGVLERVKISNPTKIDIKVKFKVLSPEAAAAASSGGADGRGGAAPAAKGKAAPPPKKGAAPAEVPVEPQAFTVQPESWEIPPHEHRFVSIYFNPTEIKSYRSVFMAEIDDEGISSSVAPKATNASKNLVFDIGGSGTLPCVAIEQPTDRDATGQILMNYSRTLVERTSRKKISIRNDGVMPATCLFELVGDVNNDFLFPAKGTSLTIAPGRKEDISVTFAPKAVNGNGDCSAIVKISVLHNSFGQYTIALKGSTYTCDAVVDTSISSDSSENEDAESEAATASAIASDHIIFPDLNLSSGSTTTKAAILIKSRAGHPLKFELSLGEGVPSALSFSPTVGHLAPFGTREITLTLNTEAPLVLDAAKIQCSLRKIEYKATSEDAKIREAEESLWGKWDDAMKSIRPAYPEDLKAIADYAAALKDYNQKAEAEKAKGKKGKPVGPPPERCLLELAPPADDGKEMIYEIVSEPFNELVADYPAQQLGFTCSGIADNAAFECVGNGETLKFTPTYLFQKSIHRFEVINKSKIKLPLKWIVENLSKRKGPSSRPQSSTAGARASTAANSNFAAGNASILSPFSIEPEEAVIAPNASKEYCLKFAPNDAGEYLFALKGYPFSKGDDAKAEMSMVLHGVGKRPVCHFEISETLDYLSRREPNLKNELGVYSSIESTDLKIVEVESVGLKTRNTFRFYVTNTTNESYEFLWEPMGEASPFWRCVPAAGMMFPGKRIELIFEYLPEDTHVAEAFYSFRLPKVGLQQTFLFAGKVAEPKVTFSSSKLDYHSVLLGGEGVTEVVYLENNEHLPFNYAFDKYSLQQLEGPQGPVLMINPKEGTVPPHSKIPITFFFKPQEEVIYNYNVVCFVKRKPNKLQINVKGEGYAVHPQIQMEQSNDVEKDGVKITEKYITLKPLPHTNVADFGSVQVLDSLAKSITVLNAGKYNFDYSWNIDSIGNMLSLSGGKLNGTLLKGDELSYRLTFAPQREGSLENTNLKFTVAGKYVYQIIPRGLAVKPALRFSFMQHNFGNCFITSPGGTTVIEEKILVLKNHDPSSNISVECTFQKIRALWVECPPSVIPPGGELEIPVRFAPREVKEYSFVVPFQVNGTSKVQLNISGSGINAQLELVNGSQRRTAFGLVNVGTSASRTILVANKSKRALPIQLMEGGEYGGALSDRCVSFLPNQEIVIGPKETIPVTLNFNPTKRVAHFSEDLLVQYAGLKRTLLTISGKAQGIECSLDTDSIPFGLVVLESQKVKKMTLENTGDLTITFQWDAATFGPHFSVTPLSGKVLPGNEAIFDIIFKPKFVDEDIRQDKIVCHIPGREAMFVTCSGVCIMPPTENIQNMQFQSLARKGEAKTVKIANPTDKDWFLTPSLQGIDWKVPYEFKVPAKGSADMPITYYPLTMTKENAPHEGKLFIALPDGSAQLYALSGVSKQPECSGKLEIETPAKKPATVVLKVQNWLGELQRLDVTMDIQSKPSPATFVIAANATEIGPNGTKEFPIRFVSFVEGVSKAVITFTNPVTGEYCFYELTARTTMAEVLETFTVEAPVRQTARVLLTLENPLSADVPVSMGSVAKPAEWWTCDSKVMRVNELMTLSGHREGSFEVEYRPLTVSAQPTEHLVTIITQELGTFKYKIIAKSTPPLLKQTLRFDASLGRMQTESFLFKAYNTAKTDFACSVTSQDCFSVQKSLPVETVANAWNGDDIRLAVNFEPTKIGEFTDVLTVSSAEGGTYVCELVGNCTPPLPQGPVTIEQGQPPTDVTFRNCFSTSTNWAFSVDHPAFRVSAPPAVISVNAKSESKCSVVFEPKEEMMETPGGIITGKLFITCTSKPEVPAWVYYLRGKINKSAAAASPAKGKK